VIVDYFGSGDEWRKIASATFWEIEPHFDGFFA
jgi:hypothetical protein